MVCFVVRIATLLLMGMTTQTVTMIQQKKRVAGKLSRDGLISPNLNAVTINLERKLIHLRHRSRLRQEVLRCCANGFNDDALAPKSDVYELELQVTHDH
ncbi:MAG: hypothetical protein KDA71_01930, partial [Planctomycetales bacterium]|nr:hypothetical protein [Planctomycetales bacterium]